MIDEKGYRPNVGIIVSCPRGNVLWARRVGNQDAWQFPQGGIHQGESPEDALYRELNEEVGLNPDDVNVIAQTRGWLTYRLPKKMVRPTEGRPCIGQKQKWFLLELLSDENTIRLDNSDEPPEFDHWEWVSYWYPVNKVVTFKRNVYRRALRELATSQIRHFAQR